jgi:hypothetical protein
MKYLPPAAAVLALFDIIMLRWSDLWLIKWLDFFEILR